MTHREPASDAGRAAAVRVGLFGLLGSGNSGNDVSMETMLSWIRDTHPGARLDAMVGGPERMRAHYGVDSVPLIWYQKFENRASGIPAAFLKVLGKGIDTARIMSWTRRHDVVIVPGAGALEATLPMNAWGFPYALFLLCLSGRLFRTKVALVSVGADTINKRATRWLSDRVARLAYYRSYRDEYSREAMVARGFDTAADRVYPDLAFGMATPPYQPGDPQTVALGVMAYYGGNDDRDRAQDMHVAYVEKMTQFACWLADGGHRVRLFGGDNKFDNVIAEQVAGQVRSRRPELAPEQVIARPTASYAELMEQMNEAGLVVAIRYHNVICALKLCKPTIALGYSHKFVSLMDGMGQADFNLFAYELEVDRLTELFRKLESHRAQVQQDMTERNAAKAAGLRHQFGMLSELLFPPAAPPATPAPARPGDIAGQPAAG